MKDKWENASQVDDIREHPIHRWRGPPSPRGEGCDTRILLSPYCHFERKREIFFVRGQAKDVRIAASGKHRASRESEGRCFMQTALRKKTETGNEKDPSAALGMTKRGNASFHSFSTCCGSQPRLAALGSPFQGKGLAWSFPPSFGRRYPEGAEVGWGKRYPRHTAFPAWGRLRYEDTAFPILSFRAKARNLFCSRSGKGCEDSGEREAPCSQRIGRTVFHADSITKENGNGKRKRSLGCARDDETRKRLFPFLFNLLRKPTPPRCARQPLPREGARVDATSFLWKEVPRRGGGWMGKAVSPT